MISYANRWLIDSCLFTPSKYRMPPSWNLLHCSQQLFGFKKYTDRFTSRFPAAGQPLLINGEYGSWIGEPLLQLFKNYGQPRVIRNLLNPRKQPLEGWLGLQATTRDLTPWIWTSEQRAILRYAWLSEDALCATVWNRYSTMPRNIFGTNPLVCK